MKNYKTFALFLLIIILAQHKELLSQSYKQDSLAVRAILDSNNLTTINVDEITYKDNNRIVSLVLAGLPITRLTTHIGVLTGLITLNLFNLKLSSLPPEIEKCKELDSLRINNFDHQISLPQEFKKLSKLRYCEMYSNRFDSLPPEIGFLNALEFLNLTFTHIRTLPRSIEGLVSLRTLIMMDMTSNSSLTLPPEIGKLKSLQTFICSRTQIDSLPVEFCSLVALKTVVLDQCWLRSIPEEFSNLVSLDTLMIWGNLLKRLPSEIGNLKKLKVFRCGSNELDQLPESLGKLSSLEILHVSSNNIHVIPESIGSLKRLTILEALNNPLFELPKEIGNLSSLRELVVQSDSLSAIPEEIGNLTNLVSLGIAGNRLTSLPDGICRLKNLELLDASFNRLSKLPSDMDRCRNLSSLSLRKNIFDSFPSSLLNCSRLNTIDLSFNQLNTIDEQIAMLKNLKNLNLKSNKLRTISNAIVTMKMAAISNNGNRTGIDLCLNEGLVFTDEQKVWFGVSDYNQFSKKNCGPISISEKNATPKDGPNIQSFTTKLIYPTLFFTLGRSSHLSFHIVDPKGRCIQILKFNKSFEKGDHAISLRKANLPNGLFFIKFTVGRETKIIKMTRLTHTWD